MLIAATLKRLLEHYNASYSVLVYTHLTNPKQIITADVLGDKDGQLLMVRPLNRPLDLRMLNQVLHRQLQVLPDMQVNRIFHDCEAGCFLPVGHPYSILTVVDASVLGLNKVVFSSGSKTAFVRMGRQEYLDLLMRYKVLNCTLPEQKDITLPTLRFEQTQNLNDEFDKLPNNVQKLLVAIKCTEYAKVVELLKEDPLIKDPQSDLWRHAACAARRAEHLCKLIPQDLDPALAYLGGLLQNFGLLWFSHLFPPEYRLLQKWLRINPRASITKLEQRLLGMGRALHIVRAGHARLGAKLLEHYGIDSRLCTIVREHHSKQYSGEYSAYVKIIQLTNQTLRSQGLGDGDKDLDPALIGSLGLTSAQITVNMENDA